jgi:hypothetical protein
VTRERITAAVAVLAAVGMLRSAWVHFVAEPLHDYRRERIDPRYAPVRALLPASGEIGYVSDAPAATGPTTIEATSAGTRLYEQAQYALAPLVLRYGDDRAPVVVANLADPAKLPEIVRERHLVLIAEPFPGTAVLRPR